MLCNQIVYTIVGIDWHSKAAPGMEVAFVVKFTPDSMKDYQCDLVCMTEREKFVVPLRAIGSRGMCVLCLCVLDACYSC